MRTLFLIFFLFLSFTSHMSAQIDLQCAGRDQHSIYLLDSSLPGILRIDSVDSNPTEPVFLEYELTISGGISINKNLDTGSGDTTMYGCDNFGQYFYYENNAWVSTGHYSGATNAINFGGSDDYIFNHDALPGTVYRYDGTQTGTLLLSGLESTSFIADIAVDMNGNFYMLSTLNHELTVYNYDGLLLNTFTTSGNTGEHGGGFAILGSKMYFIDNSAPNEYLYEGTVTGNNIDFLVIDTLSSNHLVRDIAACPNAAQPLAVFSNVNTPRFSIYPNPAEDQITLLLDNTTSFCVHDLNGRLLYETQCKGIRQLVLPVNQFVSGVHVITAKSDAGEESHKTLVVN